MWKETFDLWKFHSGWLYEVFAHVLMTVYVSAKLGYKSYFLLWIVVKKKSFDFEKYCPDHFRVYAC